MTPPLSRLVNYTLEASAPQAARPVAPSLGFASTNGLLTDRYGLEQVGAIYPAGTSSELSAQELFHVHGVGGGIHQDDCLHVSGLLYVLS
jgi:hypothetical protein